MRKVFFQICRSFEVYYCGGVEELAKESFYLDIAYAKLSPVGEVFGLIAFDETEFRQYGAAVNEKMFLQPG